MLLFFLFHHRPSSNVDGLCKKKKSTKRNQNRTPHEACSNRFTRCSNRFSPTTRLVVLGSFQTPWPSFLHVSSSHSAHVWSLSITRSDTPVGYVGQCLVSCFGRAWKDCRPSNGVENEFDGDTPAARRLSEGSNNTCGKDETL